MENLLFYFILIILIINFLSERFLDYLNHSNWSPDIPIEVVQIFDKARYQKSFAYEKANYRFSILSESLGFIAIITLLLARGFGLLDEVVRSFTTHPIVVSLLYFAILAFFVQMLSLPFVWYETFVIETRFGFNNSTTRLFFIDQIKSFFLGYLLGGLILFLILFFYVKAGSAFWIYALIVIATFSIFMSLFYATLIVPLFNKQTPLKEGELHQAIKALCLKTGFTLDNVFVIDGSKRSTKANAYFTGMGSKKRIVLYDTLINDLHTEEIVAVLAHEIGHYKKHHVGSGLALSLVSTALMLYLFSLVSFFPAFTKILGSDIPSFHLSIISFGILYSPVSTIIGLGMNYFSRRNEFQADRFAAENANGAALCSALKKLSANNLSHLTPHPAYVFFHYSHPPLLQRLNHLATISQRLSDPEVENHT